MTVLANRFVHFTYPQKCVMKTKQLLVHVGVTGIWPTSHHYTITPIMIMLLSNIEGMFSVFPTKYIRYSVPRNFDTKRELSF